MLTKMARRIALLLTVPAATLGLTVTATPAEAATSAATLQSQLVSLTNHQRAKAGCRAVAVDIRLARSASVHSFDMVRNNFFSHTGSDGSNFVVRAKRYGYTYAQSENIGWGYRTAAEMMTAWMKSSGHRANILNCTAKKVGIAVSFKANGTPYYTQVFGRA